MLRYVAIVWPGLANTGPTMLQYVTLNCCDRLAGAFRLFGVLSEGIPGAFGEQGN